MTHSGIITKTATDQKKTPDTIFQNYKDDALASAERIGFTKAATQLGVQ